MNVAIPSNVLEWITNDQPKFSFLHHESSTLTWHTLKDPSIRAFDIQIRDHRGRFDSSALPNYNLTLVFEMVDKIDIQKIPRGYNKVGWRKAHPSGASDFNLTE